MGSILQCHGTESQQLLFDKRSLNQLFEQTEVTKDDFRIDVANENDLEVGDCRLLDVVYKFRTVCSDLISVLDYLAFAIETRVTGASSKNLDKISFSFTQQSTMKNHLTGLLRTNPQMQDDFKALKNARNVLQHRKYSPEVVQPEKTQSAYLRLHYITPTGKVVAHEFIDSARDLVRTIVSTLEPLLVQA